MTTPEDNDLLSSLAGAPMEFSVAEEEELEVEWGEDGGAGEHEGHGQSMEYKQNAGEEGNSDRDRGAGDIEKDESGETDDEMEKGDEEEEEVVRPRIPVRPGVCARFAVPSFNPELDVFLMVCRKKTTIFIDAKEDTTVLELKRMIAGITKMLPEDQKLFRDQQELDNKKKLSDYGVNSGTAKPQIPATIHMVFRDEQGEWEGVDIAPLSQPPELPEVMRQQEPIGVADAA